MLLHKIWMLICDLNAVFLSRYTALSNQHPHVWSKTGGFCVLAHGKHQIRCYFIKFWCVCKLSRVKWFAQDYKVSSFAHGSFYLQQTCLIQLLSSTSTLQKEKEKKRLHNEFLIYFTCFAVSVSLKQAKSAWEATLHKILVNVSVFYLPALTDFFHLFYLKQPKNASSVRNTLVLKTQSENKP